LPFPCKSHQKEDDTLVLSPTITADNTKVVCFKFEFLLSFEGDTGLGDTGYGDCSEFFGARLEGTVDIFKCTIPINSRGPQPTPT